MPGLAQSKLPDGTSLPPIPPIPNSSESSTGQPWEPSSVYEGGPSNPRTLSGMSFRSEAEGSGVLSSTTAVKCEVMIHYLRQRQLEKLWSDGLPSEGVVLKRAKNDFVCQPPDLSTQAFGFFDEIRKLNVKACGFSLMNSCKHLHAHRLP